MPFDPNAFRSRLAQSRRDKVVALLDSLPMLPTALNVPLRLMQLHRSANPTGLDEYAEVLTSDAALSTKVLELANSAWFSRSRTITRVTDALRMIGLNNLLPLTFGLSLAGLFNKTSLSPQTRAALWRTSLLKGVVAREWLRRAGSASLAEEAFLCAVMQDLAIPVMLASDPAAAVELNLALNLPSDERASRERDLFAVDHAEFARMIVSRLQLPELFVQAVATHHAPAGPALPAEFQSLGRCLQIAAAVPHNITRLDERSTQRLAQALKSADEDTAHLPKFLEVLGIRSRELLAILAPSEIGEMNIKQFLQEVSDVISRTMFAAIGSANRTIEQLQEAQEQLELRVQELDNQVARAEYDPQTNALGHRAFYSRGQKLLEMARQLEMACAVIFIDMDNFKQINDDFGHDVGDAALARVAAALQTWIQSRGILGRCGGDEFAAVVVVPPETGRESICEQVNSVLRGLTIGSGSTLRPLSASAGVAWLGVPDESQCLQSALKVADQQMYQVKRSRAAA